MDWGQLLLTDSKGPMHYSTMKIHRKCRTDFIENNIVKLLPTTTELKFIQSNILLLCFFKLDPKDQGKCGDAAGSTTFAKKTAKEYRQQPATKMLCNILCTLKQLEIGQNIRSGSFSLTKMGNANPL